jgi:hypothetical protein
MSPFDSEFNSASNGDNFIYGKTFGKNSASIFLSPLHIYAGEKKKIKVKFLANVFP